ncbi:MAG: Dolichyl-phosphate-mannose-protein mannosyltransferase [Verrucomicrobia bacterium ADurb.Bin474]|nr:MAG: Dolichyl-phosphate-mannose-protein mannosyltransferase [Verrucomicrobia bacterium ADurb.Bin474]
MDRNNPSEAGLRSFSAFAGWLLLLIPLACRKTLGSTSSLSLGLILAGSPALLAINRSYIHESLFILFSLSGIACLEMAHRVKRPLAWAITGGVFWGLMASTKESWPLVLLCLGIGHGSTNLVLRYHRRLNGPPISIHTPIWLWASGAALLTAVAMYSSWGRHLPGIRDALLTFFIYENDPGHSKPWYYFLNLLFCSNRLGRWLTADSMLIPFVIAGYYAAFRNAAKHPAHLGWAMATLALIGIHSLIPYKTPWLMTLPFVGIAFTCSIGVRWLMETRIPQTLTLATLLILSVIWVGAGFRSSLVLPDHRTNRHAYSPTSTDLTKMIDRIKSIAALHPDHNDLPIEAIFPESSNYWPLPWYLRDFQRTAWHNTVPDQITAAIVIAPATPDIALSESMKTDYISEMRGLRPGVILRLMIRKDLWESLIESKEKPPRSTLTTPDPSETDNRS